MANKRKIVVEKKRPLVIFNKLTIVINDLEAGIARIPSNVDYMLKTDKQLTVSAVISLRKTIDYLTKLRERVKSDL